MSRRCLPLFAALLLFVAQRAAADSDAPFLWQVHGPKATHYLLGSVHLLPQGTEELPAGIEDAYDASEGLVFETDISAIEQPQVQIALLAAARSERGLKAEVGDKMYAALNRRATQIGMPVSACDPFRPWFCAMTLEVFSYKKAGFSGDNGIDKQLYGWAHEDGKEVRWLEQPASHMSLFTSMSDALSREFLASAVEDHPGDPPDDPEELLRAWQDNDGKAIEELDVQLKARYPGVYEHLLAGRNRNWMPQLKRLLDGGESQMVVVGVAHLMGPDGLIAQLRAKGYKVMPYVPIQSQLVTARKSELMRTALRR